jgi:hypothetical protein
MYGKKSVSLEEIRKKTPASSPIQNHNIFTNQNLAAYKNNPMVHQSQPLATESQ